MIIGTEYSTQYHADLNNLRVSVGRGLVATEVSKLRECMINDN